MSRLLILALTLPIFPGPGTASTPTALAPSIPFQTARSSPPTNQSAAASQNHNTGFSPLSSLVSRIYPCGYGAYECDSGTCCTYFCCGGGCCGAGDLCWNDDGDTTGLPLCCESYTEYPCGDGCMPIDGECCGGGRYCPYGYKCGTTHCCKWGGDCDASGGDDDDEDDYPSDDSDIPADETSTSTSTTEDPVETSSATTRTELPSPTAIDTPSDTDTLTPTDFPSSSLPSFTSDGPPGTPGVVTGEPAPTDSDSSIGDQTVQPGAASSILGSRRVLLWSLYVGVLAVWI
ncbi:uncharacterized protein BJX67DRAFT_307863 [Aspergillus lucknowensis]|uniref:GPI anchored protein n=1 Tax=Aspergillus lucknowensis TaxID=176173 RepID=A0ABR4M078_9EURO